MVRSACTWAFWVLALVVRGYGPSHAVESGCEADVAIPGTNTRVTDAAVSTRVESVSTDGIEGYSTYQVALNLAPTITNVYTIFGSGAAAHLLHALARCRRYTVADAWHLTRTQGRQLAQMDTS